MKHILIHYQEIALKGKNRIFFVNRLLDNLKKATEGLGVRDAREVNSRIIMQLSPGAKEMMLKDRISKVFGIANFSFVRRVSNEIESIKKAVLADVKENNLSFNSFRIRTSRGYKEYPLTSMDVDRIVGALIKEETNSRVNLSNPELTIFIEILLKDALLYTEKVQGPGGLPVGTSGRVVCLLSGGIDSPVAAWRMMKRGCSVNFVHFHSYPYQSKTSQEKVEDIAEVLSPYQNSSVKYLIPFGDIQKEIMLTVPAKYRIVLYRRIMLRIAEAIAKKEGALALVTGDSLGQVSSQTLENISTIEDAVELPVLRPLIGMDKIEIITQAKEIGTYDISIIPDQDCCQLFIPKNPAIRTSVEEIRKIEQDLDIGKLVNVGIQCISISKVA
ncbi:MAG: tRNA 4-thiouridine(8) synthase ThiI [Nitrospira sp.]|nr:tRNA 4-thiouridine(8) synthase ThiI [Nitrospira sp.]